MRTILHIMIYTNGFFSGQDVEINLTIKYTLDLGNHNLGRFQVNLSTARKSPQLKILPALLTCK